MGQLCLIALLSALTVAGPALAAITNTGAIVPTYTEPCKRSSPNFDDCMQKALQYILPILGNRGIKELELEPIDPLVVPEVVFEFKGLPDVGGKMVLKDHVTTGMSNITISAVRSRIVEGESFSMDIDFVLPLLIMKGEMIMNGKVANWLLEGGGPYRTRTEVVNGTWSLRGVPVARDGDTYLQLNRFRYRGTLGSFRAHVDNLIKDNPQLSAVIMAFVNTFWQLFYTQTLPSIARGVESVGKSVLDQVFLSIPYDQLFPK